MTKTTIALLLALGFTAGGLALSAHAAPAQQGPVFVASVNGVDVHRVVDGAHTCYVTSSGGISCPK